MEVVRTQWWGISKLHFAREKWWNSKLPTKSVSLVLHPNLFIYLPWRNRLSILMGVSSSLTFSRLQSVTPKLAPPAWFPAQILNQSPVIVDSASNTNLDSIVRVPLTWSISHGWQQSPLHLSSCVCYCPVTPPSDESELPFKNTNCLMSHCISRVNGFPLQSMCPERPSMTWNVSVYPSVSHSVPSSPSFLQLLRNYKLFSISETLPIVHPLLG